MNRIDSMETKYGICEMLTYGEEMKGLLNKLSWKNRPRIFFFLFFKFFYYYFFHFTILYWFCHTSTCICHGCTHVPHPEPPSHLPPHTIPLGHPSAPVPSFLYPALNLDWRFMCVWGWGVVFLCLCFFFFLIKLDVHLRTAIRKF